MNANLLHARQTRYGAYALTYILITLAVLVVINLLANDRNKTYDATGNKQFTLADQSVKVLNNLKQDVRIYYFGRATDFERAKDLLGRYSVQSRKVAVEYDDPQKKVGLARNLGVTRFGQIFVESGNRREEASGMAEEDVTSAIIRVVKGGQRIACFVRGSGEPDLEDTSDVGLSAAKDALQKNNYTARSISLLEKAEIPKDCGVLVVPGPRLGYPDPAVNVMKSFVEGGGHALFMVAPVLKMGRDQFNENASLVKALGSWGVALDDDLILDNSQLNQLMGASPIMPLVSHYEQHPIVRSMTRIATAFPLSRSITLGAGGKAKPAPLFSTSNSSYATTNLASKEISIDPSKDKKGPFVIAAAGTYGDGPANSQGRFVVVGSSSWIGNGAIDMSGVGNRDLFLNIMNWLSSDEDLISIRPKDPEDRRVTLTGSQGSVIVLFSQFVLPLAMLALGGSVWWKRR